MRPVESFLYDGPRRELRAKFVKSSIRDAFLMVIGTGSQKRAGPSTVECRGDIGYFGIACRSAGAHQGKRGSVNHSLGPQSYFWSNMPVAVRSEIEVVIIVDRWIFVLREVRLRGLLENGRSNFDMLSCSVSIFMILRKEAPPLFRLTRNPKPRAPAAPRTLRGPRQRCCERRSASGTVRSFPSWGGSRPQGDAYPRAAVRRAVPLRMRSCVARWAALFPCRRVQRGDPHVRQPAGSPPSWQPVLV